MKAAVMQPYLFPYIGYFQLINAVDMFVIYDDVNFIKKGWINRNNLLEKGASGRFVIPVHNMSQNRLINQHFYILSEDTKQSFLQRIKRNYSKAPMFNGVFALLCEIMNYENNNVGQFNYYSIKRICEYLGIGTDMVFSSDIEKCNTLKGQDKIIQICRKIAADEYINPIGGVELYSKELFLQHGIKLSFIKPGNILYKQFGSIFIPNLSIIDVIMFNSKEEVQKLLEEFELI